jgi:hypothetical protein
MKTSIRLTIGLLLFVLHLPLGAGDLDLSQEYLLLATKKTSTMEKELNQAAAAGYRIIAGTEMALLLESVAEPPTTYEYQLLATTKTSTMQKELAVAAAQGFRLLPKTMMQKDRMFGGQEIVVVLEKAPGSSQRYEYLLLATTKTSTMQKEITQATEDGYEIVGMVSRGEHVVIMERPAVLQPIGE